MGETASSSDDGSVPVSPTSSGTPFKFLGLEFAPLSIPWERRMQTFAVFSYMILFLLLSVTTLLFLLFLLLFTQFKWVPLLYAAWVIYDKDVGNLGGRRPEACSTRSWGLWRHYRKYFPLRLIKTAELDPAQTYLLGCHPHGILCYGIFGAFATDALDVRSLFPGIFPRLLTLPAQFHFPGSRELIAATGACAATKQGMERLLRDADGTAAVLIVGGASEALNYDPTAITLVLNRRKGFVKLALRFGRPLVPVFAFGENFIYGQASNPEGSKIRRFQDWFERVFSFSPPLFYGRGVFQYSWGFVPYRKPINVVVGKPIKIERIEDPSPEDVERTHAVYVKELRELYEEYNPLYGDPNVRLIIS